MSSRLLETDKTDPRAVRTRKLLMQAFGGLLADHSFDAITVQDIADRATVNRATFYAHFEDKNDLLDQMFEEMFRQALHKKLPPDAVFNADNVACLIQTVAEFLSNLHEHCAPSLHSQFESLVERRVKVQLNQIFMMWLKPDAAKHREDAKKVELRATVASWAIYGAALQWSKNGRNERAEHFARETLPIVMAGLAAGEFKGARHLSQS